MRKLNDARRAALAGYRRARARARKEMYAMASDYDAELLALRDEFHELALARYRKCYADAIDEARIERAAMSPGTLLH